MDIPEKPTLIELFVQLIPLKYTYAALAWSLILFPAPYFVYYLFDTSSMFLILSLYNVFFSTVTPFYLFVIARYLRAKVVTAEPEIIAIMTGGEEAYHSAFRWISRKLPVIILSIVFSVPIFLLTISLPHLSLPFLIINLVANFILDLALGEFVWEYSVSGWGLHKLGESQLKLKSFLEDRMMGARPIGNVALSSTMAYLGGLLLSVLLAASSFPSAALISPLFVGSVIALLALGIAMFFLPLNSVHKKMWAEKRRQQGDLTTQLLMMKQSSQSQSRNGPASLERVENAITELGRWKDLEFTERRLASTPTWPFDVNLIAKLITIALSVTAVLLSRIITKFLPI